LSSGFFDLELDGVVAAPRLGFRDIAGGRLTASPVAGSLSGSALAGMDAVKIVSTLAIFAVNWRCDRESS